jgi:hypothetical protein
MTIAVALKVRDGIVLAADSATTLTVGNGVANIYNHANKVVNLRKGKPIGFMTWGLGGFGSASIATLAKDFRAEVWPSKFETSYNVHDVAVAVREHFVSAAGDTLQRVPEEVRGFGFLVAGHAPNQHLGEAFVVEVNPATAEWRDPVEVLAGEEGIVWYGDPRWIQRLILGFDVSGLSIALVDRLGLDQAQLPQVVDAVRAETEAPFTNPAMPIQDAINLGGFLVDVTKGAVAFTPGAPTVAGLTEIAAVTKHEGFKWVSRKHYFDQALNPTPDS